MLLRIIESLMGENLKYDITDRITSEYGTDEWISIVYSGGDKPLSKCQMIYCKALVREIISKINHRY